MGLNINLFVHGVPMGQKIWGPKGDDQRYISSFYGPKWDTPEVMKVDVMTFGGQTYTYYSFVKGLNVCDSQGRSGSYFALTLRLNAFYSDVQNLYNILRAAYEKMCVGLCVQDNGNTTKYFLSDFQNIDSKLKDIETHIINYIGEFSINEDIISLSGFSSVNQGASVNINLHECTKGVALDCGKKYGRFMVSPYFLSTSAAKTVASYKAEIETTKQKAQQELQLQQKSYQEEINSVVQEYKERLASITRQSQEDIKQCRDQARQQVEQAKIENDRKMSNLKQRYASVDDNTENYKRTISDKEKEISLLEKRLQQADKELKSRNSDMQKLQDEVNKLRNDIASLKMTGTSVSSTPLQNKLQVKPGGIVLIVFFFVVVLIALIIYLVLGTSKSKKSETWIQHEEKTKLTLQNNSLERKLIGYSQLIKTTDADSDDSLNSGKYSIIINESSKPVNEIHAGKLYTLILKGDDAEELTGKWESSDSIIVNGKIKAKPQMIDKTCTIKYIVKGRVIATKEIKIIR